MLKEPTITKAIAIYLALRQRTSSTPIPAPDEKRPRNSAAHAEPSR